MTDLDKTNEQIDQVNLLAKTRNDFSKNVEETYSLMNELQDEIYDDDLWSRLVELNKINALLDDSLEYVWRMVYDDISEKHEKIDIDKDKDIDGYVSVYTDIINDNKLEVVNGIGKLLDTFMAELHNVIEMVRETDNDSLIYDILTENLKKWKDNILKLINCFNVCAKLDTKKKDKADTKNKDKPDTKKKDKPDTKKKDKPDTKKKDKPDSKKKDKLDTKKKDKPNTVKKYKPNTVKKDKSDTVKKDSPDTMKKDKPDTTKKDKPDTENSA